MLVVPVTPPSQVASSDLTGPHIPNEFHNHAASDNDDGFMTTLTSPRHPAGMDYSRARIIYDLFIQSEMVHDLWSGRFVRLDCVDRIHHAHVQFAYDADQLMDIDCVKYAAVHSSLVSLKNFK
ncbi:unnamed protein product [Gongylonema pulchrum]|uniref:Uncharacterized protein n=1 Tax=Gongylonema pulchrum TaxID=637853 RepID=A0A183DX20_9BILA|nr:unnamed protein product [Gongylonema pulchrum]